MFLCSYSPYPCNSNPISTVYIHLTGLVCIMYLPPDVCIYIMYIYQMCTTLVVSLPLLPHNPPPLPPYSLHPAALKQMGSPLCAVVLLKVPSCATGTLF